MKRYKQFVTLLLAGSICLYSCQKDSQDTALPASAGKSANSQQAKENTQVGFVYTLSNEPDGNKLLAFTRSVAGTLTFSAVYHTGGSGTGAGLGNQGALAISDDYSMLVAVNAGSNSISSFTLSAGKPVMQSVVPSGGTLPVSVTIHDNLVYVLNAGGVNNISGFWLQPDGSLLPIAGSIRPLSAAATGPAQVSFVQDGRVLVVTEKGTNSITSYTVGMDGIPGMMHSILAAHPTPFGFAVGSNGLIYVSEAAGGAPGNSAVSAYHVATNGAISLSDGPVSAGQTAACWVVLTNNEKYVYATNTGSNNISSYATSAGGQLAVLDPSAMETSILTPIDAALSNNAKILYVLNAGDESISSMAVANDGSLSFVQHTAGLPDAATGLIAK